MSKLANAIELYLYDLDVSDHLFRRMIAEAIEMDKLALIALLPKADEPSLYSVKA